MCHVGSLAARFCSTLRAWQGCCTVLTRLYSLVSAVQTCQCSAAPKLSSIFSNTITVTAPMVQWHVSQDEWHALTVKVPSTGEWAAWVWPTTKALQKQRLLSACTQLNPLKLCLTELEETEQTQIVLTLGPLSQNLYMYITHSITLRKLLNKPTPILATLPGHLCFSSKWISITSASKYLAKKNAVSEGISFALGHRPSAVSWT